MRFAVCRRPMKTVFRYGFSLRYWTLSVDDIKLPRKAVRLCGGFVVGIHKGERNRRKRDIVPLFAGVRQKLSVRESEIAVNGIIVSLFAGVRRRSSVRESENAVIGTIVSLFAGVRRGVRPGERRRCHRDDRLRSPGHSAKIIRRGAHRNRCCRFRRLRPSDRKAKRTSEHPATAGSEVQVPLWYTVSSVYPLSISWSRSVWQGMLLPQRNMRTARVRMPERS